MSIFTKFEAYLLTEKRVAHNTFSAYKRDIAQFQRFIESESIAIEKILVKEVKAFLNFLRSQDIGPRSMARKISTLKVFFQFAHERFGIKNCSENLIFPKIKKGLPHFLSEQEIEKLFAVVDADTSTKGIRNKVILYLLYVSGMRISELVMLRVSGIHFDTGFITILGKGEKERMVPLPQQMMELLHDYLKTVHREFMIAKQASAQDDFLFPTVYAEQIRPITRQACWIIINNLWEQTGVRKRISPHQLRHSLATHMLKKGVDLRSLQLILGHESISTVEIYTHVEVTHMRDTYDKKHPRS